MSLPVLDLALFDAAETRPLFLASLQEALTVYVGGVMCASGINYKFILN